MNKKSQIQFDDIIIKQVKCAKYLGLTLGEHLNWKGNKYIIDLIK